MQDDSMCSLKPQHPKTSILMPSKLKRGCARLDLNEAINHGRFNTRDGMHRSNHTLATTKLRKSWVHWLIDESEMKFKFTIASNSSTTNKDCDTMYLQTSASAPENWYLREGARRKCPIHCKPALLRGYQIFKVTSLSRNHRRPILHCCWLIHELLALLNYKIHINIG